MIRPWEWYIRKQRYSECQVISALNIWTFLTGKRIGQDSERYERLVDLAEARHGAAIHISRVHEALGIKPYKEYKSLLTAEGLPLEIRVWHKIYGFHSVAAVEYEPRTDSYRIPNFDRATNMHGWIYREDLHHFVRGALKPKGDEGVVRSFRLKGRERDRKKGDR